MEERLFPCALNIPNRCPGDGALADNQELIPFGDIWAIHSFEFSDGG